ncbi:MULTISPECIES: DUF305 domain-containing protein [unclassified Cryobacterium]|uniref:DUF305 domain-containing protein n=1 Tax=unclassified Cryobacterium TaxID=2649013 RepID=UPI00106BE8C3|nr:MULTISPECIES: DUF305 domain-containing protein [unclassified Cryobacterium]TFC51879.1 DUF305 domain-containing protein [Cryobacterium sp. TMB3-1-2]TFC60980.1 DUF305 domain-containing protein [Cryobacterium sp. TMB1-7]TFC68652.1 DUF305 domain-containing protein [Cryobacterium sp. TMB3-15]TFC74625.1 DUF305 domain-containing protein [Cryobacterium sp. TMB3-10]TFC90137.1 DUF305 domain-containing protein [Cryobacterium sp. TMT4-31]
MPPERRSSARRAALVVTAAIAAVAIGLVGFSVGRLSTIDNPTPTSTSAEAGFARDMQVHHLQGVELAMIIRDRTEAADVRLLGYDIATTQAQQAGQLYGWLTEWDLSQAGPEPSMTWMTRPGRSDTSHAHPEGTHTPGAPMPGLATDEQIAGLTASTGVDAERRFLTLMIAHHLGAVEMAESVQDRANNTSVLGFANSVIISQEAEITLMESMLADREP